MKGKKEHSIVILVLATLLSATILWPSGCKKKTEPAATAVQEVPSEKEITKSIEAIEQTKCPVTGDPINKDIYTEYKGKKVYFCCPACKPEFEKDPNKYISKLPQLAK